MNEPTTVPVGVQRQVRPLVERLRYARDALAQHNATLYDAPRGERSLYGEAADEIERLQGLLFASGAMADAPCFCCGYSGPGYFQPKTHLCAARHHAGYGREA